MVNTEIRLIIFFAIEYGDALYSQQKQDQELIVAYIIKSLLPNLDLNWRQKGNTFRYDTLRYVSPLRYDTNQIPYDCTVELRDRFKGLDLIDRVPDELWMEVCDFIQETGIKTILKKKKCQKA